MTPILPQHSNQKQQNRFIHPTHITKISYLRTGEVS